MVVLQNHALHFAMLRDLKRAYSRDSFQNNHLVVLVKHHFRVKQDCLREQHFLLRRSALRETELLEAKHHVSVKDDICFEVSHNALLD